MKLTQAEAIVTLFEGLIEAIPRDKLKVAVPDYRKDQPFTMGDVYYDVESRAIATKWSRYMGCGDYEYATTYTDISDIFED